MIALMEIPRVKAHPWHLYAVITGSFLVIAASIPTAQASYRIIGT